MKRIDIFHIFDDDDDGDELYDEKLDDDFEDKSEKVEKKPTNTKRKNRVKPLKKKENQKG